jgi:hypothetical protein
MQFFSGSSEVLIRLGEQKTARQRKHSAQDFYSCGGETDDVMLVSEMIAST